MESYCALCFRYVGKTAPFEDTRPTNRELCPKCEAIYLMIEAHILAKEKRRKIGFIQPDEDKRPEQ